MGLKRGVMWGHVVIEGYCFAGFPCGKTSPDSECIRPDRNCPGFAYCESNEREAAYFVPLSLILWDRARKFGRWVDGWWWVMKDKITLGKYSKKNLAFINSMPSSRCEAADDILYRDRTPEYLEWVKERR